MAVSIIGPKFYAFDNVTGNPLAFGKVYTYQAGTNTPKATFQSEDGVTANANPTILNGAGYANIYLDGSYKVVVKDADDVEVWTSDPVTDPSGLQKEWINERAATQVSPTSFSIVGNHTDVYTAGKALQLDDASYLYGYVDSVTYVGGNTVVEVLSDDPLTGSLTRSWTGIVGMNSLPQFLSGSSESLQDAVKKRVIRVTSVAAMVAIDAPIGAAIQTLGYYSAGDGGGNTYQVVAGGTGTADGGSFIDLDSGLQSKGLFKGKENVRQFGARGNGQSSQNEDTLAIDAYFQYIEDNPSKDAQSLNGARGIFLSYDAVVMRFPRGDYYYNGLGYTPVENKVIVIKGDSPDSSSISIVSDVHFTNPKNASKVMSYVEFSDIKIVGGRGAFFNEKTDVVNVAHGKRVYNCVFSGYTSVAFGTTQGSDARWAIKQTVFDGGNVGTPVGLLLGSEIAEPDIGGCNTFSGNKYDIITANDGISELIIGPSNTFFNTASNNIKEADVWFQPGDIKQGLASKLFGNRHSNENLDVTRPNILIADRDGSTASHVFTHLTTLSAGFLKGVTIQDCSLNSSLNPSTGSAAIGYILSYANKVSGLRFVGNQIGQWRPEIITYASVVTAADVDTGGAYTNFAKLNLSFFGGNSYKPINISNIAGAGIVEYENRTNTGGHGMLDTVSDGTVGLSLIHATSDPRGWLKGGSVTSASATDATGGVDAGKFTFGADQLIAASLNRANIKPGFTMFIEGDVKKSETTSLRAIQLEYTIYGTKFSYTLALTDEWQRFRVPIICASGNHSSGTFSIVFAPRLFLDVGVEDSFLLGRFCLYNSQGPVPYSVSVIT
jgi:hypothetical protein